MERGGKWNSRRSGSGGSPWSIFHLITNFLKTHKLILKFDVLFFLSLPYLLQALLMLEHATYLENVALKLHQNVVQTLSVTLAGTNTAKILNLLKGNFGEDLPSKDEEDNVKVDLLVTRSKRRSSSPKQE